MNDVLVCADASEKIGLGHVMRGMAIANSIEREGFSVEMAVGGSKKSLKAVNSLYSVKAKYIDGQTIDSNEILDYVRKREVNVVVNDIMHEKSEDYIENTKSYLGKISRHCKTVFLYGGIIENVPSDIKIVPYTEVEKGYRLNGKVLHGHKYFVPREEFIKARREDREYPECGQNILVTLGGGKSKEIVLKVVNAMRYIEWNVKIKAILSPLSSGQDVSEVEHKMKRVGVEGEVKVGTSRMAELMLWCDVAIIGDGLTKYEAAVTGTPSIMLSRPGSSSILNESFAALGTTLFLGNWIDVDLTQMGKSIERVMGDKNLRREMSRNGKSEVDGRGAKRISKEIATLIKN